MRGNGSAGPRDGARVARERPGELGDRAHAHAVLVAAGERGRPGGRAERDHVVAVVVEAHLPDAGEVRRRDRPAEGVRLAEPGVVDQDEQHVGRALGRLRPGDDRPVGDRLVDRVAHRPAEVLVRDREHGAVGHELAHRLRETVLKRLQALLVGLDDRLRQRARQRLLDTEPLRVVERRDDPGRPGRQVLADLVVHLRLDPVVDEPADQAARDRAHGRRREQRRRGQTDEDADGAAPLDSLAAAMVGRLLHGHGAVLGVRDQDRGLHLHLLALDGLGERVEVARRCVDVRVCPHQDIGRCVSHQFSPVCVAGSAPTTTGESSPGTSRPRSRSSRCDFPFSLRPSNGRPSECL